MTWKDIIIQILVKAIGDLEDVLESYPESQSVAESVQFVLGSVGLTLGFSSPLQLINLYKEIVKIRDSDGFREQLTKTISHFPAEMREEAERIIAENDTHQKLASDGHVGVV